MLSALGLIIFHKKGCRQQNKIYDYNIVTFVNAYENSKQLFVNKVGILNYSINHFKLVKYTTSQGTYERLGSILVNLFEIKWILNKHVTNYFSQITF